jgi:hypothetical protein
MRGRGSSKLCRGLNARCEKGRRELRYQSRSGSVKELEKKEQWLFVCRRLEA